MDCESKVNAGFAFAILSELIFAPILVLSVLVLLRKIPPQILSFLLFAACPLLLLFSIISLATYGDCVPSSFATSIQSRASYSLSTGIRAILYFFFLLLIILLNKFLLHGDLFLRPDPPPPTKSYTPDQNAANAQSAAYSPPPQTLPPPQHPPPQPQPAYQLPYPPVQVAPPAPAPTPIPAPAAQQPLTPPQPPSHTHTP